MIRAITAALLLAVAIGCASEEAAPPLRVGSTMRHHGFSSWNEAGEAVGMEAEIVRAAAAELGREVEWVPLDFEDLMPAIVNGEIDLAVSTIGITPERRQRVAFSDPYYETQIVALVRDDDDAPSTLLELSTARIAAEEVSTAYEAAREQWPDATLVPAPYHDREWLHLVVDGEVDAFVVDATDQARLEELNGVTLRRIEAPLTAEIFGVSMALDATELRDAVNRAIAVR